MTRTAYFWLSAAYLLAAPYVLWAHWHRIWELEWYVAAWLALLALDSWLQNLYYLATGREARGG